MADKSFFLWDALEQFADNLFYCSDAGSHTYAEVMEDIKILASYLDCFAITQQERVAVLVTNSYKSLVLIFALFAKKAVPVLVAHDFPLEKLKETLTTISCKKIISEDILSQLPSSKTDFLFPELTLADNASIMFTSGSSALPKAVMHSFGNHYYSALGSNKNVELQSNDRWLLSLPIHHIGGFSILFRALLAGATIVQQNKSENIYEHILKHNISHISLVETQTKQLIQNNKKAPDHLKAVLLGGGKVNYTTIKSALELSYPIFTTYGMTEMTSQITTTPPNTALDLMKTSGKLLDFRQIKIAPDNEILVKGETLCAGYLNAAFPLDSDGWFHTSDIGTLNNRGFLTLHGRKDNMLISGGENIYPEEIETLLMEMPAIEDVVIVPKEDDRFGQLPVLFYKSVDRLVVTQENVYVFLSGKIEKFKIPKTVYPFPQNYTPSGIKPNRQFLTLWLKEN